MIGMKVCKLHMCTIIHMHITTRVVVVAIGDVLYYIELEFIV